MKNNEALIGGSIDLSALEALEDAKLDIYVYAVICDQMRATEGISSNFAGSYHSQMTEAVKKLIEDNLTSVLEDKDNELAQLLPTLNSLETLKDTAQLTLGQLRDFIGNKTVHSMLNGSGESSTLDNAVTRFKNALNRLPANASVTVKVGDNSYTLDTDDLKTLQNGLVSGFQELVNETNGALKLADFDVEDGLEVTVKYNTRTFVFYLWIDGLTA